MLRYAYFVIRRIRVLRLPAWFSSSTGSAQRARTASTSVVSSTYCNNPAEQQAINSSNNCASNFLFSTATSASTAASSTSASAVNCCSSLMVRPIVISGPSGGGKSTILAKAMKEYPDAFAFSVSHTTRKPRIGEVDGEHYHFVERPEMERMIAAGEFFEHAHFGGNIYGTSKKAVQTVCASGKICVLDVELQGVHNFKKANFDANYILIQPPSIDVLENRLRQRGTETDESIEKRLKHAREDLAAAKKEPDLFNAVVVNEQLDKAYADFMAAIRSELDMFQAEKQQKQMKLKKQKAEEDEEKGGEHPAMNGQAVGVGTPATKAGG